MSEDNRFKPGVSGNPAGRPKIPDDIKQAKRLNKLEVERLMNKFMAMTKDEISQSINDPTTPALEIMIGSIIAKAVSHGDPVRLNFLLDRLIGKVKDELDVTVIPRPVIIERHDGTEIEMTTERKEIEE